MAPTSRRAHRPMRHRLPCPPSVYMPASRCAGEGLLCPVPAPPQRKTGRWNAGLAGGPRLVVQRKGCSFGMPLYEHTVIARPDLSAQQAQALADTFGEILTESGRHGRQGRILGSAQPVLPGQEEPQGPLSSPQLDAPAAALTELERTQRIHEDVLRYLTVRVEALEEGPSQVMIRPSPAATSAAAARPRFDGDPPGRDRGDRGTEATAGTAATVTVANFAAASVRYGERRQSERRRRRPRPAVAASRRTSPSAGRSSAAASRARSPTPTRRRSTTRTSSCCSASSPSAARSCRGGSPP